MPAMTIQTIPVTDIRPGDLIDAGDAEPRGPVIRVRDVAVHAGRVYVLRRESGDLVPEAFTFRADQHADLYGRTAS